LLEKCEKSALCCWLAVELAGGWWTAPVVVVGRRTKNSKTQRSLIGRYPLSVHLYTAVHVWNPNQTNVEKTKEMIRILSCSISNSSDLSRWSGDDDAEGKANSRGGRDSTAL